MLTSLILMMVAAPLESPVLPAGSSAQFQRLFYAVEEKLTAHDFDAATKLFHKLPSAELAIQWDDAKVPVRDRENFSNARNGAVAAWAAMDPAFEISPKAPTTLKFDFEPVLAPSPETKLPAGIAMFFENPTEPATEAVIGLHRGAENTPTSDIDVRNDVAFAIGSYFGVAASQIPGTIMGRNDNPSFAANTITGRERDIVRANLAAIEVLRKAIHTRTGLFPLKPDLNYDPTELSFGPVIQGQRASLTLQLTNRGSGPLVYNIIPDCGCVGGANGKVLPGQSTLAYIEVDTTLYTHDIQKHVLLLTNDAEKKAPFIPLTVRINPRYRFIYPEGDVKVLDGNEGTVVCYLEIPFGSDVQPLSASVLGLPGTVEMEPWSGELADPENGEGPKHRKGYKLTLKVKAEFSFGRPMVNVLVPTGNSDLGEIRGSIYFQKGIAVFPEALSVGDLGKQPKKFSVIVSRPGLPFKILGVTAEPSCLSPVIEKPDAVGDTHISIHYDGKASSGDFLGVVHIKTDDPKQALIDVRITGYNG